MTGLEDDAVRGGSAPWVEGVVVAQRPGGLYDVDLDGTRRITAHVPGGLGRNFVRLLVGDRVAVELTARDRTRGRIVRKLLQA